MTRQERLIGEACREAAETVLAEAIRGLDLEFGRRAAGTQRAIRPRWSVRVLGPLAAAVSVAVIAVAAIVVVPRLAGGAPAHTGRARHAPAAAASGLAGLPEYTVLSNGNAIEVVVTATGRVAGRLGAPAGQAFAAVAGTAGDRTFLVAADLNPQTSCQAFFYRFSLSADGQPSALIPLLARSLPGLPTALAASATGGLVGYSVVGCASGTPGRIGSGQAIGRIGLFDVAAGKITRQWGYTLGEDYTTDLSMSADGSLLGYSNYLNASSHVGRVLPASAPSGPDQRHSRIVIRQPISTALSADGRLMYALTGEGDQVLAAYDTASGQQVKVLHRWPASAQPGPIVADPAGRFLLLSVSGKPGHRILSPFVKGHPCAAVVVRKTLRCERMTPLVTRFVSLNLTTGTVTMLPFRESGPVGWGMVAW